MSDKVSQILDKGPSAKAKAHGTRRGQQTPEDAEFKNTLREVLDFVTPQLGKRERQQYEEAKIRALGGTLEKREKMPCWLMQKKHKQAEEMRQQQLKEEKLLGVSMSVSQHRAGWAVDKLRKQKKEALKAKKERRDNGLLRLGLGARESRGMAVISKRSIAQFRRKVGK